MSRHSFHDSRGTKNMLAHGVQQRIGVFRPRPRPADHAKEQPKENNIPAAAEVKKEKAAQGATNTPGGTAKQTNLIVLNGKGNVK